MRANCNKALSSTPPANPPVSLLRMNHGSSPNDIEQLFNAAQVAFQQGNHTDCIQLCEQILSQQPDADGAWALMGMSLTDLDRATDALRQACRLAPDNLQYAAIYLQQLQQQSDTAAITELSQRLQAFSDNEQALILCARARRHLKQLDEAETCLQRALSLSPDNISALHLLGLITLDKQQPAQAIPLFRQCLERDNTHHVSWLGLGNAHERLLRNSDAIDAYKNVLNIDSTNPIALTGLGRSHLHLGQYAQAASYYQQLWSQHKDPEALLGLAVMHRHQHQYEKAESLFKDFLTHRPDHAEAWQQLGDLYGEMRDVEAAVAAYERHLSLIPEHQAAYAAYYRYARELCLWQQNKVSIQDLLALAEKKQEPHELPYITPGQAQILPLSRTQRRQLSDQMNAHIVSACDEIIAPALRQQDKIRLGYLSHDIRNHPVAQLTAGLYQRHDRKHFHVQLFSTGPDDRSSYRQRVFAGCDDVHLANHLNNQQLARLIQQQQIDILIDLGGHASNGRPGVLALRPAPLQIHYLGFAGPIGKDLVDYTITDHYMTPGGYEDEFSEQLIYLPDCFMVSDDEQNISGSTPAKETLGLPEQTFVFACLSLPYKIDEALFQGWLKLLNEIDNSVLWLPSKTFPATYRALKSTAQHHGIDPSRLILMPYIKDKADYLAALSQADLALDTWIYNGHTSCNDALYAGLPYLTLCGETFVSRVAASQLHTQGLDELITHNEQDYFSRALFLAQNKTTLASLKKQIVAARKTHPLFNTERFVQHLDRALLEIWKKCQTSSE